VSPEVLVLRLAPSLRDAWAIYLDECSTPKICLTLWEIEALPLWTQALPKTSPTPLSLPFKYFTDRIFTEAILPSLVLPERHVSFHSSDAPIPKARFVSSMCCVLLF